MESQCHLAICHLPMAVTLGNQDKSITLDTDIMVIEADWMLISDT